MSKALNILFVVALGGAASGCATMETSPPTAEQRAACVEMMAKMGDAATHSHSADKGAGPGPMAMTHAQCKRILG